MLNIAAKRTEASASRDATGTYLRRELTFGNYSRSVQVPGEVRQEEIKASFDNGILTIELPKVPAARPVRIQIEGKSSQKQLVGAGSQKK
jgi:HSP20 family protein